MAELEVKAYFFDFQTGRTVLFFDGLVMGVRGSSIAVITEDDTSGVRFFSVSVVDGRPHLTTLTPSSNIRINKVPVPPLREFPLNLNDIVELSNNYKFLFTDRPDMTIEEGKKFIGRMLLNTTYKTQENLLQQKNDQAKQIQLEMKNAQDQEEALTKKLKHLDELKRQAKTLIDEINVINAENLPAQIKTVQGIYSERLQVLTVLQKDIKQIEFTLNEKKKNHEESRLKLEREKEEAKRKELEQEEEELQRKMQELAERKKKITK